MNQMNPFAIMPQSMRPSPQHDSTDETREEIIQEFNEQSIGADMVRFQAKFDNNILITTDNTSNTTTNKKTYKNKRKRRKNTKKQKYLYPLFIDQIKKCGVYHGKQLIGRTVVMPCRYNAVSTIIEDDFGAVIRASFYGQSNMNKFTQGVKVCIDEPYYKLATDGKYRIRMDDPTKVHVISKKTPIGIQEKSVKDWKDLANKCFMDKNYVSANKCYSNGINYYNNSQNDSVITAVLNNRALCHIKQNKYQLAFIDIVASKYINPNVFKTWQRQMLCLTELKHYKAAISVWNNATKIFSHHEHQNQLNALRQRLQLEAKSESETVIDEWDILGNIVDDIGEQKHDTFFFTANELKERGNEQFHNGNYDKAIEVYSQCLVSHYNILSICLSNRSASWIKLKDYKKAFQDATISVIVNPSNMKGWFRRCIMSFKLNLSSVGSAIFERYGKNKIFTKLAKNTNIRSDLKLFTSNYNTLDKFNKDILFENLPKQENIMTLDPEKRLHYVLKLYNNWVKIKKNDAKIKCQISFSEVLEKDLNYFHHDILNDFHLILNNNNNQNQLCKLSNCHYIDRNNRKRNASQGRGEMYFGYDDSVNCCLFQTLDSIHCALFHENETRNQLNDKFVMKITIKNVKEEKNDDTKTDECHDAVQYNTFGFGQPFLYHDELQLLNSRGIYVTPYFDTLEEELLNNPYYKLTQQQYDDIYAKASNLLKTDLFKNQIKAKYSGEATRIGFRQGQSINIYHVISLLIYCNETQAQKIFKEQCRKSNVNTNAKTLTKNHSYIANWMTYLFEAVRIYGVSLAPDDAVYTGINSKLLFSSFSNFYYAPLSTSSSNVVARNFATVGGIVIKLKSCSYSDGKYFDMMPLSDFVHEKEKFFLSAKLDIVDIIIQDESYFIEVCALRLFERIISGYLFYNECNANLISDTVQVKLIEFINNYLKQTHFKQDSNQNYMQNIFNNMITNFLNPHNYDKKKWERLINDTFLIFVDKEEMQKLNAKLREFFFIEKSNYGLFLSSLAKRNSKAIHFCSKRVVLSFYGEILTKLRTEEELYRMRHCYSTEPFKVLYMSSKGKNKFCSFILRICKISCDNQDRYEFFLRDVTKRDHYVRVSYDLMCKETNYQRIGETYLYNRGTDIGFVGFLCSKLKPTLSELNIVLNFRILDVGYLKSIPTHVTILEYGLE